jgi:hypothetical protein
VDLPLPPGTHTVLARTKESAFELKNSPFTCTVLPPKGIPLGKTATSSKTVEAKPAKMASAAVDIQAESSRVSATPVEDNHPARLIVGSSNIETVILSSSGAILVLGWAIAHSVAVKKVSITTPAGACTFAGAELARSRRKDIEKAVSGAPRHKHFGIFGLGQVRVPVTPGSGAGDMCTATIEFENGISRSQKLEARCFDDAAFVEIALNAFSALEYYGNNVVESFAALDGGLGNRFIELQAAHVNRIARARLCERFGTANGTPRATIIVCIYGRPEYQFLQNAQFGLGPSGAEYEFIYVCNSPELIDGLHKAATISQRIYGLSQAVVALPANAGFGMANNVAANYARSDRLLFVNPDVFPRDNSWGRVHRTILEAMPKHQTTLFGARLFYSDGSLMHAGMHIAADTGVSIRDQNVEGRPVLRVEHFGKGAPPRRGLHDKPVALHANMA